MICLIVDNKFIMKSLLTYKPISCLDHEENVGKGYVEGQE